ncbi:helix-turn-helix transcriptional regulator [Pseudoclavibacter sp. 13-3]|uniref:helix-turn-helix transcriptional regulator n=1 Tax=Pseudoclavibacter sp. 13-3 TaxID=2901228 RepID=UPI001E46B772|nr:WYL domain-containing protein [Pseudoclavibacter sp. 13-3]MCD7101895.1 WYL domain-containing protein [Pseudoclavibacter sp. 13-3]
MADRVTAEERMLNLVLALQHTRFGLTKRQILSDVSGYSDDLAAGVSMSALERRFERDKAALRALGIDVVAADDLWAPGDNQLTRYHIDEQEYALPEDLELSGADLGLLTAAALLLSHLDASEGRRVAERARALSAPRGPDTGDGAAAPDSLQESSPELVVSGLLDVMVYEPNLRPLQAAALEGGIVRFDYHTQDHDDTTRRTVLPLAVVLVDGRWHLHGVDLDRLPKRPARLDDPELRRTFLLQRIRGVARSVDEHDLQRARVHDARVIAAVHSREEWAKAVIDDLEQLRRRLSARLRVRPGSEAAVRLGDRLHPVGGTTTAETTFDVQTTDYDLLADEITGYGDEVTVISPESLRTRVEAKQRRLLADHSTAGER